MSENNFNNRAADADLLTRVGIALTMRLSHTLHAVHIQVDNGVVTLRGLVPSFYDRQLAIEVARRVAGVLKVRDELSVATPNGGFDKAWAPHSRSSQAASASHRAGTGAIERSSASAAEQQPGWKALFANAATVVRGLFLSVAVIGAVGCGGGSDAPPVAVYPAQGKITFKGQPIPGAAITLHPTTSVAEVPAPSATVGKDGAFALSTFKGGDGAPEGVYKLTVRWYKLVKTDGGNLAGPNVIPPKYTSPETSDVEIKIAAGQNEIPTIKL